MKKKITKLLSVIMSVVLMISVLSVASFAADEIVKRTETLDLNGEAFASDCANEAEGWSWDADTLTLTLNNADFDTGDKNAIALIKDKKVTVNMVGESTISTMGNGLAFSRGFNNGSVLFNGDGILNVNYEGNTGSMDVGSFTIESGTLNIKGGAVFVLNSVKIKGGTINIDTLDCMSTNGQGLDGFYILDDGAEITGGTVDIKAERCAFFVVGNSDYDSFNADKGLVIKGGDVTLYGAMAASWVGYIEGRETVIETTGTVTIKGSEGGIGLYCGNGSIDIRKGIINNPDNLAIDKLFRDPNGTAKVALADYSAVDAALAKIPEDLSQYTEESVAAIQAAVDAVDRELTVLDQAKVDGYVAEIETALEGLEEDVCWLVKIFRAIIDFFTNIFKTVFGFSPK